LTAQPLPERVVATAVPGEDDWRWQLRRAIRSAAGLERALTLTAGERAGAMAAERGGFPILVTPYLLSLADRQDPGCPIRRQFVPDIREWSPTPGDRRDPLGEEEHEVAPGLIRRYPDRALLLVSDRCAGHCRFCTRRRWVGRGGGAGPRARWAAALAYLARHPEVKDVIVSGGDPLVMSTRRLADLVASVRRIESVETIRLATRVPAVLPQRVTEELLVALRPYQPLWVMTHFNHPRELGAEARAACRRLADAGFPVMNQTVLLRGVNDRAPVLAELFRGLVRERVRPYYLLQMDPVCGTGHLRTPVEVGRRLLEELQGQLSGIATPRFVVDTPGGHGKVPVAPDFVLSASDGVTRFRAPDGAVVDYLDPAGAARLDSPAAPR